MVNINSADASQLALLPRVGPSVAQRIVDYRKENGPFKTPEDLMLVQGIGEKTFQLLKPYVAISGETTLKEKVQGSRSGLQVEVRQAEGADKAGQAEGRRQETSRWSGAGAGRPPRRPAPRAAVGRTPCESHRTDQGTGFPARRADRRRWPSSPSSSLLRRCRR